MLNWIVWNRTGFTFNCAFVLDRNKWNYLTMWKIWAKVRLKIFVIYIIYMYKNDLGLNNLEWLKCHKTKSNQTNNKEKRYVQVDV